MFSTRRFLALAVPLAATLGPAGLAGAGLRAGDMAPDFHKTDLDGNLHTLFQYRGKVVVLFLLGYS